MKKLTTICAAAFFVGFISIGDSYGDLMVDDFEAYNGANPISNTWIDGDGIATNGAVVDVETSIVWAGDQSMEFSYANTGDATYSEVAREISPAQDWSTADLLSLLWHGTENSTGQLYVKVNESKLPLTIDDEVGQDSWHSLYISLAAFGDPAEVTTLALGIDGTGATGTLYFDNIKVIGDASVVPVPGAVLLGILGLGAVGIKLRKFA